MIWKQLSGGASFSRRLGFYLRPSGQVALVGEVFEVTLDRAQISVEVAPSKDVKRESEERHVDKNAGPCDAWLADTEQHRDPETHDPEVEAGAEQRAHWKRWHRAVWPSFAPIQRRIQDQEDRDSYRGDEIPAEVVANRHPKMGSGRVVPEQSAEKPLLAQYAQGIDHEIDHHHEQSRHQPHSRGPPDFPGVEHSDDAVFAIKRRTQEQRHAITGEPKKGERKRAHERHAEHPNLTSSSRTQIVVEAEWKPVVNRGPFAGKRNYVREQREKKSGAEAKVDDRDEKKTRKENEHIGTKCDGREDQVHLSQAARAKPDSRKKSIARFNARST